MLLRAGINFQQRAVRHALREYVRVRCPDDELEVETHYGFRIGASPRDWMSHSIYFYGMYDDALTTFVQTHVLEGDVCWDVGAGVGWFSLRMARCAGPSGRVEAFEAFPPTFSKLERHRNLNGFDWLHLHAVAASDTSGSSYFVPPERVHVGTVHNSGLGHLCRCEQLGSIEIASIRLDDFAEASESARLDFDSTVIIFVNIATTASKSSLPRS